VETSIKIEVEPEMDFEEPDREDKREDPEDLYVDKEEEAEEGDTDWSWESEDEQIKCRQHAHNLKGHLRTRNFCPKCNPKKRN